MMGSQSVRALYHITPPLEAVPPEQCLVLQGVTTEIVSRFLNIFWESSLMGCIPFMRTTLWEHVIPLASKPCCMCPYHALHSVIEWFNQLIALWVIDRWWYSVHKCPSLNGLRGWLRILIEWLLSLQAQEATNPQVTS